MISTTELAKWMKTFPGINHTYVYYSNEQYKRQWNNKVAIAIEGCKNSIHTVVEGYCVTGCQHLDSFSCCANAGNNSIVSNSAVGNANP